MALVAAVGLLELVVFLVLAAVSVAQWRRRRSEDTAWMALTLGALAVAAAGSRLLPGGQSGGFGAQLLARSVVAASALFPYCLFRFASSFSSRRGPRRAAGAGMVAIVAATLALPPVPVAGAWWLRLFGAAFLAYWTAVSYAAVRALAGAWRGQPAVARRRLQTVAAAAVALNASLLVRAGAGADPTSAVLLWGELTGLAGAVLFLVAAAPPRALRTVWRREDMDRLRMAEAHLLQAPTADTIGIIALRQASLLIAARAGVVVDGDGGVLARHGDDAAADELVASLARYGRRAPVPVLERDRVTLPLRSGWLALRLSASMPFFGADELLVMETLGNLTGLAIERATAREILAEREAQLAEAQRTAHLGSYTWDLATGQVSWSAEMHRLLGFGAGEVEDYAAAFLSRVHPGDREAVLDAWSAARTAAEPGAIEYRVVLADGTVRWMQGRMRPAAGAGRRVIGTVQDVTERKLSEEAIAFQALHDALTRLPNRSLFMDRLAQAMTRRARHPGGLAVLFLDLDRFKWLNDSRGHAAGDELLVKVAERLESAVRPGDTVARFGGDEFVILCEELPTAASAENMARRVSAVLAEPLLVSGEETSVTVSIGIAFAPPGRSADTPETLLRDADAAMYQAKDRGRDRHETFSYSTRLQAVSRHETVNALRRGIDRGELVVHFQPEVDLATGDAVGVEALVRWNHPERGLLGPGEFIALAEETGLIVPLGARVLHDACHQVRDWQGDRRTATPVMVSVNLSTRQLMAPDLCDTVEAALEESGLDPSLLCLEITESVLLEDAGASSRALFRLKALGVRIGVDDFGTGFSSLTYLKRFPVDLLKIDRSFVQGLGDNREDRAIVASVVDLAHAFGLTTIAEGVETVEQLAELRDIGCEIGQGYLWSRPLPAVDARRWIGERSGQPGPRLTLVPGTGGGRRHRVLVVDDEPADRTMLRLLFDTDGYEVVGEAVDGREAVALAGRVSPGLVVLDMAMPGMGGMEALPLILAAAPDAKVVVVSAVDDAVLERAALRLGAVAWVAKDRSAVDLLDVVTPLLATA
ncbi:MAG TPA: EAL domain-containing protein [Acidimicrobiales bacterium]|nr:EAL domain-containing protein [Acidimicrobiales bacterium]